MANSHKFTWDELISAPSSERRKMWAHLRSAAPEKAEWWENAEGCYVDGVVCQHYKSGWCGYAELPCGINPYLTPRTGIVGMACMGMVPEGQVVMDVPEDGRDTDG